MKGWMLLGLVLLAAPASVVAQEKPAGNDCQNVEGIAGSLPYRMARLVLQGNAQTYGAAAVADDQILSRMQEPLPPDAQEGAGIVSYKITQLYGTIDVPTIEQSSGCPRELMYSLRPLDVATTSFGFGYLHPSNFGLFYTASVSYSFLAADNAALRGMTSWSGSIYSTMVVLGAPFLMGARRDSGLVSFNADYVVGGSYNFGRLFGIGPSVTASLGYVGTQGVYARLGSHDIRAALSAVVNPASGIQALDLPLGPFELAFGKPYLRLQRRALIAPGITNDKARTTTGSEGGAWSTAHMALFDVGSIFDLEAQWMFEPRMMPASLFGAVHSTGFNDLLLSGRRDIEASGLGLRVGVLNRPTMRYYGVDGGYLFSVNAEARMAVGGINVVLGITYNDPRRLELFPFAENHLAVDYAVEGTF